MALPYGNCKQFCLFVLIVALCVPATQAFGKQHPLTIDPANLHFQKVVINKSTTLPVTITNTGQTDVTIESANISNPVYGLSGLQLPLTLSAGQKIQFGVTFSPLMLGNTTGTIVFSGNEPGAGLTLGVYGIGVNDWSVTSNPGNLQFGSVQVGAKTTLPLSIVNSGTTSVTISTAQLLGLGFSVSGVHLPLTLDSGQSYTFQVTFAPRVAGAASGDILATSPMNPVLTIPLSGTGTDAGQLTVFPSNLNFGNVTVGTNANQLATLTAAGSSVTISSASSDNSEFTVSGLTFPFTVPSGQSATFTVIFSPQTSGTASGTLSFVSNAPNSPTVEGLAGNGVQPEGHQVTLSWDASESPVIGYNVYRSQSLNGPFTRINAALDPSTSYVDTSIAGGQTYFYVTTAVNASSQESAFSNEVEAVIP